MPTHQCNFRHCPGCQALTPVAMVMLCGRREEQQAVGHGDRADGRDGWPASSRPRDAFATGARVGKFARPAIVGTLAGLGRD
jgi:hypothetical protein